MQKYVTILALKILAWVTRRCPGWFKISFYDFSFIKILNCHLTCRRGTKFRVSAYTPCTRSAHWPCTWKSAPTSAQWNKLGTRGNRSCSECKESGIKRRIVDVPSAGAESDLLIRGSTRGNTQHDSASVQCGQDLSKNSPKNHQGSVCRSLISIWLLIWQKSIQIP